MAQADYNIEAALEDYLRGAVDTGLLVELVKALEQHLSTHQDRKKKRRVRTPARERIRLNGRTLTAE